MTLLFLLVRVLLISLAENDGNHSMPMNLIRYDLHAWLTRTELRTGFLVVNVPV
jgi:hypothetical protein